MEWKMKKKTLMVLMVLTTLVSGCGMNGVLPDGRCTQELLTDYDAFASKVNQFNASNTCVNMNAAEAEGRNFLTKWQMFDSCRSATPVQNLQNLQIFAYANSSQGQINDPQSQFQISYEVTRTSVANIVGILQFSNSSYNQIGSVNCTQNTAN